MPSLSPSSGFPSPPTVVYVRQNFFSAQLAPLQVLVLLLLTFAASLLVGYPPTHPCLSHLIAFHRESLLSMLVYITLALEALRLLSSLLPSVSYLIAPDDRSFY
jgi:hypothetical protein